MPTISGTVAVELNYKLSSEEFFIISVGYSKLLLLALVGSSSKLNTHTEESCWAATH